MHNRLKNLWKYEPIKDYNRLMKEYNWQQPDWPNFSYDLSTMYDTLISISEKVGLIKGKVANLSENLQSEAMINLMIDEAIKTSQIEGEQLSRPDIKSSIKNKLGLNHPVIVQDKRAQGVVDLLFDVRKTFQEPFTELKICEWHLMLMASAAFTNLKIASWRTHEEPMQIVSASHGKVVVYFEAPPSKQVPEEMQKFIHWFNQTAPGALKAIQFGPVRAAIAHLYFESIHPFEDGNGRIGRAIAEKALFQGFGGPVLLSLSQAIEAEKKTYYSALHAASKSNEITAWIRYFVNTVLRAQVNTEQQIHFILKKAKFFANFENSLNDRQLKVVRRMWQEGPKGFEGGMSARKYTKLTGVSKATATRDLQHLHAIGALRQIGAGRNIQYELDL